MIQRTQFFKEIAMDSKLNRRSPFGFGRKRLKYMMSIEATEAKNESDLATSESSKSSKIPNNGKSPRDAEDLVTEEHFWQSLFKGIYRDKKALVGLVMVFLFILIALLAPWIVPHDPYAVDMEKVLIAPNSTYVIGTDFLGRDILSRIIYGARISLVIGLVPTLISLAIGTFLGMVSGYFGGKIDYLIMRLADVCMAFPSLLLAMVVMYTLGASLFNIFIALSIVNWGSTSRIVRAQTLSIKEKEFVEAARSIGVGKFKILWRHIFPNCIPSLIVLFTLSVPEAIMSEASLSFLGVGAQPPTPSWGLMISRGKEFLFSSPWVAITPGVAIFLVVIAFNFIGDGLRDALDPYTKH
ncbi:ABC transporter permease [Fusibacter ferrireducens]|nr:ABC transporter permease [Fusibacter ferrireducens]